MIKLIIFDVGGILVPEDTPFIRAAVAKKLGIGPKELDKRMDRLHSRYTSGKITLKKAYDKLLNTINRKHLSSRQLLKIHFREYRKRMLKHDPKVRDFIISLTKKYKVVALTNTEIEIFRINKKVKLYRHFGRIFSSTEIGAIKPSKKIYRHVLKALNSKPSETIFIDDRIENVKGAASIGIHAIHYKGLKNLKKELKKRGVI